jgi:hypothetical protein
MFCSLITYANCITENIQLTKGCTYLPRRPQVGQPRSRRGSAAARLLGLRIRIPPRVVCLL